MKMSRFETTKWSLILAARGSDDRTGREALAELCQAYWFPLFAFARSRTTGAEAAADQTQGFFADLLERKSLDRVDPRAQEFPGPPASERRHAQARRQATADLPGHRGRRGALP
jgi:RNA polymerase sigma-70 factor (ECF subfamily)